MENDFLKSFVLKVSREQEQKKETENRKQYFRELGKKGGLKKKRANQLLRVVSVRFTEKEFKFLEDKAQKYSLKISTYLRMVATKEELKVKEFETDKILLEYGNHFIRIANLLRNSEWSAVENKKNILMEIETVLTLIKQYLYRKIQERENLKNEEL
ncbi:plasmid mobilization protein [Chryseobacterium arthrosphaerae]|uniref:plasmid mobilization protein n=1 Tax=Chryseobacterium arthrosphaerae TaxID=651561 RepID=UPI001F4B62DF|nr:special sigma factor [Chryseobacterium arthrosphaerae]MDG4654480.1 special sigma factor [Chryseobacterium arthrosphaerae]